MFLVYMYVSCMFYHFRRLKTSEFASYVNSHWIMDRQQLNSEQEAVRASIKLISLVVIAFKRRKETGFILIVDVYISTQTVLLHQKTVHQVLNYNHRNVHSNQRNRLSTFKLFVSSVENHNPLIFIK